MSNWSGADSFEADSPDADPETRVVAQSIEAKKAAKRRKIRRSNMNINGCCFVSDFARDGNTEGEYLLFAVMQKIRRNAYMSFD